MRHSLLKRYVLLSFKLALAAGLVGIILLNVDVEQSITSLKAVSVSRWICIMAIPFLQAALLGLRWRMISCAYGHDMSWSSSFGATLISFFFSQGLPASVGGDAFRIWWQKQTGVQISRAVMTVLIDRLVGFSTLVVLTAFSLWFLASRTENEDGIIIMTLLLGGMLFAIVSLILLARFDAFPRPSTSGKRTSWFKAAYVWCLDCLSFIRLISFREGLVIFSLGILVHALTVLIVFVAIEAMTDISFLDVFAATSPALLLSYLPISIAGWGVREVTIVTGFSLIDVPAEISFPVSLIVGLAVLMSSLIGGAYWICGGIREAYTKANPESA